MAHHWRGSHAEGEKGFFEIANGALWRLVNYLCVWMSIRCVTTKVARTEQESNCYNQMAKVKKVVTLLAHAQTVKMYYRRTHSRSPFRISMKIRRICLSTINSYPIWPYLSLLGGKYWHYTDTRLGNRFTASRRACGIKWAYILVVIGFVCPNKSPTSFKLDPAEISQLA